MNAYPPSDPPMPVGERFVIQTGPRRLLHIGDRSYFQKKQRRYFCKVLSVKHERFRRRYGCLLTRCVCEVEVIAS